MKSLRPFLLLCLPLLLLPMPGGRARARTEPQAREWTVDGVTRKALIYLPTRATQNPPVVFVFHGHGGSMRQAARSFHIQDLWPEAVCVYMQGLNTPGKLTDPTGRRAGWQAAPGDQQDRDLKFFDAVYTSLRSDYKIDESRVFSTGHSNGGGFTYLLWATRPKLLRAVAPSSAVPGVDFARDLTPKPALHLAGERDPLVKYAWQERAIAYVKRLNGCSETGTPWAKAGSLIGTKYESPTGTPLITLIHPGGHVVPPDAPALIVRFFQECDPSK